MNSNKSPLILVTIILTLLAVINSAFIVNETQQALVFQFGRVINVIKTPGIHFKIPMVQEVDYFDKRILNLTADEKEFTAKDQKRLLVNAFTKYKINDPLKFYQTVRDDLGIKNKLNSIVDSSMRQIIGEFPLSALLTVERTAIMKRIQQLVNNQAASFGVTVVDVRIMRADLPKENSEAIYKRMQTEREKEAKEFRAEGAEEAQRIKSRADKERTILLAEEEKKSQMIRGEGDFISSKTFADAFGKDPDFFAFYRSMQAYLNSFNKNDTTVILTKDTEFMKHFGKIQ